MIPNKLNHGDNLANLFEKFNAVIDYLREIRLVAGHGIRLNRLHAGTTIESTVIATGGGSSAPASGNPHPFDVELINSGTEESPSYSVKVFNSALPDSQYAGIVYIGTSTYSVPVDELEIVTSGEFFVDLVVTYDAETDPVYSFEFVVRTTPDVVGENNVFRLTIAAGKLPEIASMQSGNITVTGRWV